MQDKSDTFVPRINPVGTVVSPLKERGVSSCDNRGDKTWRNTIADIVLKPEFTEAIDGIEECPYLLVLYWAHLNDEESRSRIKIHPMQRLDLPKQGVFSTCSPNRPNPILATTVKFIARDKNVLTVKGLDALDGSPVLDIKPFTAEYHETENLAE